MKKILVMLMTLALSTVALAGCAGGGTAASSAPADTSASADAAASAAAEASADAAASAPAEASASAAVEASIPTGNAMNSIAIDDAEGKIGDAGTLFVDLRKAEDYAAGHIEGAISAPMNAAVDDTDYDSATATMASALGADLDAKDLILICYKGKKYAQAGTDVLTAMGADMSKVFTLEGGMEAWTTAGKALEGEDAADAGSSEDPTRDNPIVVDKAKGEIRYLGFVDGVYLTEGTRHAVVYGDGSNGHKTIITGYGDEKEFYQACIDLGWEPGNNLTLENQKGTMGGSNPDNAKTIEGELLDVTIRWDGQDEMPIWDCIEATNGDQRPAEWHFGGNIDRANEKNTGCVLCIDSCAVGIVSNAAWPSGTTDADGVTYFHGKADVLPADGTDVIVTFRKAA